MWQQSQEKKMYITKLKQWKRWVFCALESTYLGEGEFTAKMVSLAWTTKVMKEDWRENRWILNEEVVGG